ncbi:polyprenyl synthetase family protein, partial [Clostridium perfringens]
MKPQLTLDEALDISLRSVDREIENMEKYDKDIPRSSALGKSIVE